MAFSQKQNETKRSWAGRWKYVPLVALAGFYVASTMTRQSHAGEVFVLGDSIGEDIGRVAKQKTLAKVSVSLANRWIYRQIANVPPSSTVVMSLGTNDADNTGGVGHLGKYIDALVAATKAANLKIYWLGPVCVRTGSDARSAALDKILAEKLASTQITYVSMRKPALCDPSLHARDGQHFRDAGSRLMWQEVSRVAGFNTVPSTTASAIPAEAAPKPVIAAAPVPPTQPHPHAPDAITPPRATSAATSDPMPTGSINKTQATTTTAAHTTVAPQVSLDIVPIGQPHPVSRPAAAANTIGRTPQVD